MFRSRFHAAFPPKLAHFGPQDIERAVFDAVPSPQAEALLCALLGMVLNRKKPVEYADSMLRSGYELTSIDKDIMGAH